MKVAWDLRSRNQQDDRYNSQFHCIHPTVIGTITLNTSNSTITFVPRRFSALYIVGCKPVRHVKKKLESAE